MVFKKHPVLFSAFLGVLLGGSVWLNFRLFNQAKHYYIELNATRLDPVGLNHYPTNATPIDSQTLRVVLLGDSRAASWILPTDSGYQVINRGIPSQTTTQTIARFASHVRPLNPDVVVLQVGVNDLKTIALFPERRDEIVANCKANIQRIVQEAERAGAVVILTTIFPVGEIPLERKPFWSDAIAEALQTVNAEIKTLADKQTIVLDTFPILADPQGVMLPQYSVDELHLNESGYTALNQELLKIIRSLQPSSK